MKRLVSIHPTLHPIVDGEELQEVDHLHCLHGHRHLQKYLHFFGAYMNIILSYTVWYVLYYSYLL